MSYCLILGITLWAKKFSALSILVSNSLTIVRVKTDLRSTSYYASLKTNIFLPIDWPMKISYLKKLFPTIISLTFLPNGLAIYRRNFMKYLVLLALLLVAVSSPVTSRAQSDSDTMEESLPMDDSAAMPTDDEPMPSDDEVGTED